MLVGLGVALSAGSGLATADPGSPDPSRNSEASGTQAPGTEASGREASGRAAAPDPSRPGRGEAPGMRVARAPAASPTVGPAGPERTPLAGPHRAGADLPSRARASARLPSGEGPVVPRRTIPSPITSSPIPFSPITSGPVAARPASEAVGPTTTAGGVDVSPAVTRSPPDEVRPASPQHSEAPIARSAQALTATSPLTTATVVGLALTNVVQFAVLTMASILSAVPAGPFAPTPALRLNGFDLVPTSPGEIISFYGRWAYLPGVPGLIQSRQQFGVIDPTTGDEVGTFGALVGRGNGIDYTQMLVTSSEGPEVGAAAGSVPPVGSVISNLQLGRIGFSYSALAAPSGNVVSFTITTPFGDIAVPIPFDYAAGIADRTVDNKPIRLGNGYSIVPADPAGETITAVTGLMPGFMTVQGHQIFSLNDSAGHSVGTFEGVFTTTADLFFYTQAVLVTGNDGTNVGTGPGQTPPVGSVFNIIYFGTDNDFLLYSALPAPGGSDVSVIRVNRGKITSSAITLIDAAAPLPRTPISGGGYRFVPVSDLLISGVNGLPPREVEIQGYQQFAVYNSAGAEIGSVDADVFTQWDAFGLRNTALLITDVTRGGVDVPPAGSIVNVFGSGEGRFVAEHSTVAWPSGSRTSFSLLTPLGEIRLPPAVVPPARRAPVSFYSPFRSG